VVELTQPLRERQRWLRRLGDLVLAREEAPSAAPAESVSFAELVWAHAERQKEVLAGVREGPWEREYRRRLGVFQAEHGRIAESYWCRFEASGVALTEKRGRRRPARLYRRDLILRLHSATDWRTANAPAVARCLHQWETAGIKAAEILRDTSERVALSWIFAASARLLGFVDRDADSRPSPSELEAALAEQQKEQQDLGRYYMRAGDNSARIVFFRGMVAGTAVLALLLGALFFGGWWLGWLDPRNEQTYTLFVVAIMGAGGAILSVMTRMAKENGFALDFEVGRKSIRFLGGLRPWIGALFALALYLALTSSLVEFVQTSARGLSFYATIAFLAGFSERRAKVLLDSVGGGSEPAAAGKLQQPLVP
jgi:hypothetical protein